MLNLVLWRARHPMSKSCRIAADAFLASMRKTKMMVSPKACRKNSFFLFGRKECFCPFFKRWHAYKHDVFAWGVSQKLILNLRARTAVSHFILTRFFDTPRVKRKFLKSHQLRWICVPGVILERYVRKATEIKNMRFVRGVSQKRQNAYFGPRVFRRSPPRDFCDTPHAKRSCLTKWLMNTYRN